MRECLVELCGIHRVLLLLFIYCYCIGLSRGMALSQIQCLDENNVNPRTHESKAEFLYCEEQRLALEALLADGRGAFGQFLQAHSLRGFLSDPELDVLTGAVEPYDPGLDLYPSDAEDDEPPLSLHYWPELSDRTVPQLDLGWPDCVSYRGVTRTTVYAQPPLEGQTHIKEIVRKTIAQAQKVIAVVMDMFTDVDIFRDLLDAGFKRGVSVYIMLERTSLPHFLSMSQRANMHVGHLKNLRVRCAEGVEFYTRSCSRVRGRLGHRFMFIDGDKAVSGSYSYTWMSSRLDKHLITVVTGQAVDAFDKLFCDLYAGSSAVNLRQVATEPAPEPGPLPQHTAVVPLSAAMARKLYNPKYALVTMGITSATPASSGQNSPKDLTAQNQTSQESRKRKRRKASVVEAPPLHPGLVHLEKAYLIPYLPVWPEPDPPSDVIGFINIRDANRPTQVHLQRSERFETSQAIRFKNPLAVSEEARPEVALPRHFTTRYDTVADKLQAERKEVNSKPGPMAPGEFHSTQIHNGHPDAEPKERTIEQKAPMPPGPASPDAGLEHVDNHHTAKAQPKTQAVERSTHTHEMKHITTTCTSLTHTPKPEPKTETLKKEANAHNLSSDTPTGQNENERTTPLLTARTPSGLTSKRNPESIIPTHPAHTVATNTPVLKALPVSQERPTKQTTSALNTLAPDAHGTPSPDSDPTSTSNPASSHVLASLNTHATHMLNQPHTGDQSHVHIESHTRGQAAQTNVQLHVQAQRPQPLKSPPKNTPSPFVPTPAIHKHIPHSSDSSVPPLSVSSTSSSGSTSVAVSSMHTSRPAPMSSAPTTSPSISFPSIHLVSSPAIVLDPLVKSPPIPASSPHLPATTPTSHITSPPVSSAMSPSRPPAPPVPKPRTVQLLIKGSGGGLVDVVKRPGCLTGSWPQTDQTGTATGPLVDQEVRRPGADAVLRSERELQSRSGIKTGTQTDTVKNFARPGEGCLSTQQTQYETKKETLGACETGTGLRSDYKRISATQMATRTKLQAQTDVLTASKPQMDNVIGKERTASERETKTVTVTDIQSTPKSQRHSVAMLLTHTEALTRAQTHSESSEVAKRGHENVTQPNTDLGATKETLGDYGSVLQSQNEGQGLTSSPEDDPHALTPSTIHTQRHTPVSCIIMTKYNLDGTKPTPAPEGSGVDTGQHSVTSTHNSQGRPIQHTTSDTVREYRCHPKAKDLRLYIPDSAAARTLDLLSPTSDRDLWSPTPLRTPTPDRFSPRTPTPDSRTHTPDLRPSSLSPDVLSDGYWSPREDSIVSTSTSEEYYECSETPFSVHDSVDVFDRVPNRKHWTTEENVSSKNVNTAATTATITTITSANATTTTTILPPSQAPTPATAPALPPSEVPTPALPPSQDPATSPALPPSQAPTPALPSSQAPATAPALPPSQAPTPALPPSQAPTPALPPSQAPATAPALPPSQAPTPALPPSQAPTPALPSSQAPATVTALPLSQAPTQATAPTQSFTPTSNRSSEKAPTPAFPTTALSHTHRKVSPKPSPSLARAQPLDTDGAPGKHAMHPRQGQRAKKDEIMETYQSQYGKKTSAKGLVISVMEEAGERSEQIPIERPRAGELPTLSERPGEVFYTVLESEKVCLGEFQPEDSTVEVKRVKLTEGENRQAALASSVERMAETPVLGPGATERRDRPLAAREPEGKEVLRTPPRLPRGQYQQQHQQDGRLPFHPRPTLPARPTHPLSVPHPSGARPGGGRPMTHPMGMSRSAPQGLDNAPRRPPFRQAPLMPGVGPTGAVGLGPWRRQSEPVVTGRARAGQTHGQSLYPKPQASFLHTHASKIQSQLHPQNQAAVAQAQPSSQPEPGAGTDIGTAEALRQELGKASFGFSFSRLYNLTGLKDRMSRPAAQRKRSSTKPATQGYKSTG